MKRSALRVPKVLFALVLTCSQALGAPDQASGAGCANYGVAETSARQSLVFEPTFVSASLIDDKCNNSSRRRVRGCYFDNGTAYIVKNDDKAYWHEWCHAKFGPAHVSARAARGGFVAQRLASNS